MLAAVTGLAYTLATLLKLESYLGYFLPLPVIISALQSGAVAGLKTVTTAFLLLFSEWLPQRDCKSAAILQTSLFLAMALLAHVR